MSTHTIILLVGVLVAVSVGLLFLAVIGFVQDVPEADRQYQDPLPFGLRLIWPLVNSVTFIIGPRLSPDKLEKAHHALCTAGQDFVLIPEQLYGLRVVSVGMVVAFFWLVLMMLNKHQIELYATTLALGMLLGWFYPSLWLSERRKHRQRLIIRDLPVYLDFMTLSVEAGLNITG
ncbi:MAG: type II secretion system F family protein, partial [Halothiobacillus sp.]